MHNYDSILKASRNMLAEISPTASAGALDRLSRSLAMDILSLAGLPGCLDRLPLAKQRQHLETFRLPTVKQLPADLIEHYRASLHTTPIHIDQLETVDC
jgi:hypothetical protein